jgi:flavodoxin I
VSGENAPVSQGQIRMKEKPNHAPNLDELIENFDRALSHPDNEDLDRLGRIIRKDFSK